MVYLKGNGKTKRNGGNEKHMKGKRQVNRGDDSKFKLTKVLSALLVVVIASSDIVPFVNIEVDTINGVDKTGVELGLTDEGIVDEILEEELLEEITEEELLEAITEEELLEAITEEELLEEITEEQLTEKGIVEELEEPESVTEELNSEEGGAELEELNSLEGLNTGELTPEQPKERMRSGVSLMSLSPQSTNNYVMAKDSDFSGTSNGNFKYIGSGGYVEIPHTIKGVRVTSYANMFNNVGHGVQGVKSTNKNVTSMVGMFSDFQGSATLDVSQLDTSGVTNMNSMFQGTTHSQNNLRTIIGLENFDTSNVQNFSSMFYRSAVSRVNVSNFDTSRATYMYRMFGESHAWELDLSNFDTSRVTSMEGMFRASRLSVLDLRSFDTSRVTNMTGMFSQVQGTTILVGDGFKTDEVRAMNSMFSSASVRSFDFSGFNTSKVTSMASMFNNSRLTEIDVSGFDTSNVTDMSNMFLNSHATSIKLGGKFNTTKVETMNSMFKGARATTLDLSNFNTSNVTDMIYMFMDAHATSITIGSNFKTDKVTKMTQMFSGTRATSLNLSGFNTQNVTDMGKMFMGSHAKELDLRSFSTSRLTTMEEMFANTQATKIDVTSFDTTYVTDMKGMFDGSKVTSLDLSSFDMTSVNTTGNMFRNTSAKVGQARTRVDATKLNNSTNKPNGLTFEPLYQLAKDEDFSGYLNGQFRYIGNDEYVEIPRVIRGININSYKDMFMGTNVKGVLSTNINVTDMSGMFKNTQSTNIDVRSINTQNVTTMSGMFEGSKVTSIDLTRFDTSKVTNMSNMFRYTALPVIDLGGFDLSNVSNTSNMFQGTKAEVGYARTTGEVSKLNSSSNKPTGLTFTVWGITTTQSTTEWTNQPIDLSINAVSGLNGISYVEMVNETGRNYALNSRIPRLFSTNNNVTTPTSFGVDNTIGARWVHGRRVSTDIGVPDVYNLSLYTSTTYDSGRGTSYSEDLYPVPDDTVFSLDVMSEYPIRVGFRGGTYVTLVPNQWTRITKVGKSTYGNRPEGLDVPQQPNIPIGARLYYRNYKIEKGTEATPWKPAPEDSESSSEQSDTFKIYENGTYVFRATDVAGETKVVTHRVSNIDTNQPTAEITKSTSGWTSQDVEIYVNAKDDLSGVDYITLPDGRVVKEESTTFIAKDNGKYTFKITDRAGNTTSYTEEVTNIDRSIPSLTATLSNRSWTRDPINIEVKSEDSMSGLSDITMINSPRGGRNLLRLEGITEGRWIDSNTGELIGNDPRDNTTGFIYVGDFETITLTLLDEIPNYLDNLSGHIHGYDKDRNNVGRLISNLRKSTGWNKPNSVTLELPDGVEYIRANLPYYTQGYRYKIDGGTKDTPYTPAPEDIPIINNSKTYPVVTNGLYTFQASYNNGTTSEVSVNVTNIDLDAPRITVLNNPEDWTEDNDIVLEINANDNNQSGVRSITLPDGRVVTGNKATYRVSENGEYVFKSVDNVGNETIHTETVDRLMIPYGFYIFDSNNKPLQGARFALLREGGEFRTGTSDATGYVDFGKVPASWSYSVRQLSSPDGGTVLPGDIDIDDPTDPIEVINYPRGKELPSTGTVEQVVLLLSIGIMIPTIVYVAVKKKKYK